MFNFWLSHFNSFSLITIISIEVINNNFDNFIYTQYFCPLMMQIVLLKHYVHIHFSKFIDVIRIHVAHNLPEPFCHLSFYLMPISHESSHYKFQSNLFPLWTAAVHIKEKKKSKNCTTILSLPNLLRTFNWKGEMATAERQYVYIKKNQQQQLENKIGK